MRRVVLEPLSGESVATNFKIVCHFVVSDMLIDSFLFGGLQSSEECTMEMLKVADPSCLATPQHPLYTFLHLDGALEVELDQALHGKIHLPVDFIEPIQIPQSPPSEPVSTNGSFIDEDFVCFELELDERAHQMEILSDLWVRLGV